MVGLVNLMAKLSNSIKWYYEWIEYENNINYYKSCANYALLLFGTVGILITLSTFSLSNIKSYNGEHLYENPEHSDKPKSNGSPKKRKID